MGTGWPRASCGTDSRRRAARRRPDPPTSCSACPGRPSMRPRRPERCSLWPATCTRSSRCSSSACARRHSRVDGRGRARGHDDAADAGRRTRRFACGRATCRSWPAALLGDDAAARRLATHPEGASSTPCSSIGPARRCPVTATASSSSSGAPRGRVGRWSAEAAPTALADALPEGPLPVRRCAGATWRRHRHGPGPRACCRAGSRLDAGARVVRARPGARCPAGGRRAPPRSWPPPPASSPTGPHPCRGPARVPTRSADFPDPALAERACRRQTTYRGDGHASAPVDRARLDVVLPAAVAHERPARPPTSRAGSAAWARSSTAPGSPGPTG